MFTPCLVMFILLFPLRLLYIAHFLVSLFFVSCQSALHNTYRKISFMRLEYLSGCIRIYRKPFSAAALQGLKGLRVFEV